MENYQDKTDIEGIIQHIRFRNSENDFTVFSFIYEKKEVVAVGKIFNPKERKAYKLSGTWKLHPIHGYQFESQSYIPIPPSSKEGMIEELSSGIIPGIGKILAGRIVNKFGEATYEIIENDPDRLKVVPGISEKRTKKISEAFIEEKTQIQIISFLKKHKISPKFANKIFRIYRKDAIYRIEKEPYQLIEDIPGIGFKKADEIAKAGGIKHDSIDRIKAGIIYVLGRAINQGHVYLPFSELTDRTIEELKIDNELIFKVLLEMDKNSQFGKKIVIEKLHTDNETVVVFDAKLKKDEENVALRIASINCTPWVCPVEEEEAYTFISEVEQETKIILENEQRKAIKASFFRKFLVCTGGPGTGKTTIIQVIARLYDKAKFKVLLVAPTGRAAKRMTEATGYEAKTIHRALEYSYEIGGFRRNQENPIDADIIVIDEASMVDIKLMSKLLSAIKNEARVILIGDINQLPSVGPGRVLRDIIESKVVTVVELKYVFRQAQKSNIVVNAHLINKGIFPKIFKDDKITDFNFINNTNPSDIQKIITDIARNSYFKSKSLMECQVLSPMRKGALGVDTLNQLLQKSLNTSKISVTIGFNTFCLGDKVMQLRNNYQKDVYNGDIGIVERIDNEERVVEVMFGSKRVEYEFFEIDDLTLSYACTIHKSQGSEYDTVIIPVVTQHYIMLARNLLYTAITRGKKKVVIIGSHKAISIAVNNNRVQERFTHLRKRLTEVLGSSQIW